MTVTLNSRAIPETIQKEVETALHATSPALVIEWREDSAEEAVLSLVDKVALRPEAVATIIEGINETVTPIVSHYRSAEE